MFAYCKNSPIIHYDPSGYIPRIGIRSHDDEYEHLLDEGAKDGFSSRDKKKREKEQTDRTLGERGSKERDQNSRDLHDAKRKRGGGNNKDIPFGELEDGNYYEDFSYNSWIENSNTFDGVIESMDERNLLTRAGLCLGGSVIIVGTLLEDLYTLGVGVADDPLTLGVGGGMIINAFSH